MCTWLPYVSGDKPVDMVYVEMGSNDLCQCDDPRLVAKHLVAFEDYFCESQGIQSVYLGQFFHRFQSKDNAKYGLDKTHMKQYNALVVIFNRELSLHCNSMESGKVHYWRHRGVFGFFWGPGSCWLFHNSGIHLNKLGMKRFIHRVRHAILHASNHVV